jgi:hypothetical protein
MLKNILKYIVLTALRDWFFTALVLGIFGVFGISALLGFMVQTEQIQMQLSIFAGTARLLLAVGMIVFICFYIAKSFENKEIPFILSKNISREKFVVAYYLGFNIVAQILLLPVLVMLSIFYHNINLLGALQWFLSVGLELAVLTSFCIAISLIIRSPVFSVLATFGFYILSRMMGFFTELLYLSPNKSAVLNTLVNISNFIFRATSSLVPRLDVFGQTTWLLYGPDSKILLLILLQSMIYIPLLFFIAFYDFRKKQF